VREREKDRERVHDGRGQQTSTHLLQLTRRPLAPTRTLRQRQVVHPPRSRRHVRERGRRAACGKTRAWKIEGTDAGRKDEERSDVSRERKYSVACIRCVDGRRPIPAAPHARAGRGRVRETSRRAPCAGLCRRRADSGTKRDARAAVEARRT
jgi:hypothetical protein